MPAADTLRRIQKDAQNPKEFAKVMELAPEPEKEGGEGGREDIAKLKSAVADLSQRLSNTEQRLSSAEQHIREIEGKRAIAFAALLQEHARSLLQSPEDVARATELPVDRIQAFFSGQWHGEIDPMELGSLGLWYGALEPLLAALGVATAAPPHIQQYRQCSNGNGKLEENHRDS